MRKLWVIAAAAFAIRIAAVVACAQTAPATYEHGAIAENLLAGRGFSIELLGQFGPTAQQGPIYPLLLALLYALLGVGSHAAHLTLQVLQAAAGAAVAPAGAWLAWSLWPKRPALGWLAAIGVAIDPVHVYMTTHVQVVVWVSLLLAWLAAWAFSGIGIRLRWGFAAGALSGALVLLEPILALALPWLAIAWWRRSASPSRLRWMAASAAGFALVLAPWTARNWLVFGEPVFVKSTFGYAFWQGNNPLSWGTDKIPKASADAARQAHDGSLADRHRALVEARSETLYIDDVLLRPGGFAEFQGLTEPQRCRLLGRRARDYIVERPGDYARLCAARLRYFLLFDATNPKAADPIYRAATLIWLTLLAIGLASRQTDWRLAWPLAGLLLSVVAFHTLTITSARFRIPLEPLTFGWAAMGIAPVIGLFSRTKAAPVAPSAGDSQPPEEASWRVAA